MIDITSKINELTSSMTLSLSQNAQSTNESVASSVRAAGNDFRTEQSRPSADSLMNQIGLEVQRQGGQ